MITKIPKTYTEGDLLRAQAALDHVLERIKDRFGAEPEPCENRGSFIVAHLAPGLADAPPGSAPRSAALLDQVWQEATGCDSPKAAAAVMRKAEQWEAAARKLGLSTPDAVYREIFRLRQRLDEWKDVCASPEQADRILKRASEAEEFWAGDVPMTLLRESSKVRDAIAEVVNEYGGECDPARCGLADAWELFRSDVLPQLESARLATASWPDDVLDALLLMLAPNTDANESGWRRFWRREGKAGEVSARIDDLLAAERKAAEFDGRNDEELRRQVTATLGLPVTAVVGDVVRAIIRLGLRIEELEGAAPTTPTNLEHAIEMVDELDGVAHERLLTYLKGRYA